LRFLGQLRDVSIGIDYNYFRDYDAATGRFVESDPIGLAAGINTYTYVGNPISMIDPLGLLCRRGERILSEHSFKVIDKKYIIGELTVPFIGQVHGGLGLGPEPSRRAPGWRPGIGPSLSWDIVYFKWRRYEVHKGWNETNWFSRKYYCTADDPCRQPKEWVEIRPDGIEQDSSLDIHREWEYVGMFPSGYNIATP
jgi:RHS repeat-associated protein